MQMHEGKLSRIAEFAARGVKVMQLSYNLPSRWASGVMSPHLWLDRASGGAFIRHPPRRTRTSPFDGPGGSSSGLFW